MLASGNIAVCCYNSALTAAFQPSFVLIESWWYEQKLSPSPSPSNPMVTGTSVLGVKFTGGVIIAADMLGSYGSLARFRNISRLMKVSSFCLVLVAFEQTGPTGIHLFPD